MAEKQAYGSIPVKHLENTRKPYEHQSEAMHCLDTMKGVLGSFSTMVVLPTGGGKTYTASNWLLRRAINERKKVLWIAHRHALLDQAAQSFEKYAFDDVLPQIESFTYRIVSGLPSHCPAFSMPHAGLVCKTSSTSRFWSGPASTYKPLARARFR